MEQIKYICIICISVLISAWYSSVLTNNEYLNVNLGHLVRELVLSELFFLFLNFLKFHIKFGHFEIDKS